MTSDWIKMRSNLRTDPDVIFISEQLEIDEFSVVGRLHTLWSWADQHTSTGTLQRTSPAWIDRFVSCQGFSDALVRVGWLVVRQDSLILPEWDRHNGSSAKSRAKDAIRKKSERDSEKNKEEPLKRECLEKSGKNLDKCPGNVQKNPDKTGTRIEKNRNIINIHTSRERPKSCEEALEYAKGKPGYELNIVQHWFAQRDSQNWIKANNQLLTNWRSDLDAWVLSQRNHLPLRINSVKPKLTEAERDKANTGLDPLKIRMLE